MKKIGLWTLIDISVHFIIFSMQLAHIVEGL